MDDSGEGLEWIDAVQGSRAFRALVFVPRQLFRWLKFLVSCAVGGGALVCLVAQMAFSRRARQEFIRDLKREPF
ncbi:MAG: hypothetical protein HYS45_03020 [Parcubacteria group bacterium]|nr:hypothetical protein [Parcubacteria group bacterium]